MPLETRKTSNPTTEESQTGAFSLQQKIGFRKLQVQFFHLSQIIRINIMNLINTFKTCQNVSRCVNMLWEKNKSKKTSNRINLQVGSLPELSRRLLREDQMARGEFEFASTLGNWKTKCHESPWNFFMSFSERKLLIVSCCPPKKSEKWKILDQNGHILFQDRFSMIPAYIKIYH